MRAAPAIACVLVAACGGAPDLSGVTAWLRVDGAQFYPGAPPSPSGGPAVTELLDEQPGVRRGEVAHAVAGTAAAGATAVALFLDGDAGFWVVPTDVPDITAPDQPTFAVETALSPAVPDGPRDLSVRAVDAAGRAGAPRIDALLVAETAPPSGALVVSLAWDTEADLDLHVVEPDGVEIWSRTPGDPATGGTLDRDSNRGCAIDGVRAEDVVWATAPPRGHYVVRVDTASLCAAPFANWTVAVTLDGAPLAQASGESTPPATRAPHDRGAGVTAVEFDVP